MLHASSLERDDAPDSSDVTVPPEKESSASNDGEGEPWKSCREVDKTWWIEKEDVGCVNDKKGFYHKASKGDVYNSNDGEPFVTYDGTYQGCQNLCVAAIFGDLDGSLNCGVGYYITYSESANACYFYTSPGGDNGCNAWRPKSSDQVAMYCGFT